EGVAPARRPRGMRAWTVAIMAVACVTMVTFGFWLESHRHERPSLVETHAPVVVASVVAMVFLVACASRVGAGRLLGGGWLLASALVPAFAAELYTDTFDAQMESFVQQSELGAANLFEQIARARIPLYGLTAIALLIAALGFAGAVLTIDLEHHRTQTRI